MNNELYFKDCFTEIEEGKINAEFNKISIKCLESIDNKFSMDCEGNLVVNSLITREKLPNESVTIDDIYPVGSIYMSVADTDPSALFGGVWERIVGRFLLGAGENYKSGTIGGEENHILNVNEMPQHLHEKIYVTGTPLTLNSSNGNDAINIATGASGATTNVNALYTSLCGNNKPHNNMPPFLVVNIWKRVA